ncbi:MAG: NAD(P)H-dependent oxidoreductase [Candidatus Obscuribacter sp.]|nr:NAD(P)H-dependent oxidoreductase [Candidatus Obscuribacter sp.]
MKVLIVHAHHEPKSFCSALADRAKEELIKQGHAVTVSDLYAMKFNPVSDRSNFTTVKDSGYLKQQAEEMYATEENGFAPDLEAEMEKLEQCDALIFTFPLWWFGMPAILKGWCDRVLASGRIYGGGKFYESGLGQSQKRALLITTTGGGTNVYDGWGLNPALERLMEPVQHGIFWFNGFLPLEPFVAWSPARLSQTEREQYLSKLGDRISTFFEEKPLNLPLMADFPNWGPDAKNRYRVVVKRIAPIDDKFMSLVAAEQQTIAQLKREGVLMDFEMSGNDDPEWRAFMKIRAADDIELHKHLQRLPLASYLHFDITKLKPVAQAAELSPAH